MNGRGRRPASTLAAVPSSQGLGFRRTRQALVRLVGRADEGPDNNKKRGVAKADHHRHYCPRRFLLAAGCPPSRRLAGREVARCVITIALLRPTTCSPLATGRVRVTARLRNKTTSESCRRPRLRKPRRASKLSRGERASSLLLARTRSRRRLWPLGSRRRRPADQGHWHRESARPTSARICRRLTIINGDEASERR